MHVKDIKLCSHLSVSILENSVGVTENINVMVTFLIIWEKYAYVYVCACACKFRFMYQLNKLQFSNQYTQRKNH